MSQFDQTKQATTIIINPNHFNISHTIQHYTKFRKTSAYTVYRAQQLIFIRKLQVFALMQTSYAGGLVQILETRARRTAATLVREI